MVKHLCQTRVAAYESPSVQFLILSEDERLCVGSAVSASYEQVEELDMYEW